jgi:CDP-2,3-bis-(O-geranylgeranyl)-sn-glycerol synthase
MENILITFIAILYFILPAYISNIGGLAFGGGTPVDFNKNFKDDNRLIGNGVTWRGLIAGTILGMIIGAIQGYFGPTILQITGPYLSVPICLNIYEGVKIGFLLGLGALLGDACGSFIKRRLGINRGKPAPILDQLDFLIGALLLGSLAVNFNLTFIIIATIMTVALHLITNMIAYSLGLKDVWY